MANEKSKPMVLPCAGAANVGQLSNQAAVELVREGHCRPFCLAAIGAHKTGYVRAAQNAETVVIDGCDVGCAKGILEQENITPGLYVVITSLGVEKSMAPMEAADIERVKESIKSRSGSGPSGGSGGSCRCCGEA